MSLPEDYRQPLEARKDRETDLLLESVEGIHPYLPFDFSISDLCFGFKKKICIVLSYFQLLCDNLS